MGPEGPILQANLNHSARAQDLFLHVLAEWKIGLAVAAEPYRVPDRTDWFGDEDGSVAIIASPGSPPAPLEHGRGYVGVAWRSIAVVGLYAPPSWPLAEFEQYLDRVGDFVSRCSPRPVLVLGDFNAHASLWGSPRTDARGKAVQDWAAGLGLLLLNEGSVSTCVRAQGESIVDLSFATPPAARMVQRWRVVEEAETLSDHLYIRLDISTTTRRPARGPPPLRWALKRMDEDALMAAALALAWPPTPAGPVADIGEEVEWFRGAMKAVCDTAMPRAKNLPKRAVYWWTGEIADLWRNCQVARRQWQRARRRRSNRDPVREDDLYGQYRVLVVALQTAIREAKSQAMDELLGSLQEDPWGRPCKLVMGKLRPWAPPVTESLDPQLLGRVEDTLFPRACPPRPTARWAGTRRGSPRADLLCEAEPAAPPSTTREKLPVPTRR
uniref:uncharacterized protein LOC117611331 n=1 Tax=Osmia lignaria TaxID=473952 RepID=UPI00147820AF|nr:uncharacterized protein LOC117611331 [Osmia lignaria]